MERWRLQGSPQEAAGRSGPFRLRALEQPWRSARPPGGGASASPRPARASLGKSPRFSRRLPRALPLSQGQPKLGSASWPLSLPRRSLSGAQARGASALAQGAGAPRGALWQPSTRSSSPGVSPRLPAEGATRAKAACRALSAPPRGQPALGPAPTRGGRLAAARARPGRAPLEAARSPSMRSAPATRERLPRQPARQRRRPAGRGASPGEARRRRASAAKGCRLRARVAGRSGRARGFAPGALQASAGPRRRPQPLAAPLPGAPPPSRGSEAQGRSSLSAGSGAAMKFVALLAFQRALNLTTCPVLKHAVSRACKSSNRITELKMATSW